MNDVAPQIYLVRHGETEWSATGRHTGLTDIPLTAAGEQRAQAWQARLAGLSFETVRTSPLQRAQRTCELAGWKDAAQLDSDLVEWDYGQYEGLTTAQIRAERPNWNLFRDGCPGGESLEAIGARADRVVDRLRASHGNQLLFSSSHFLRVLTARWLGLSANQGRLFLLDTATVSILGYEHNNVDEPVLRMWNARSLG